MKKLACYICLFTLSVCLLFSGCKKASAPNNTPIPQDATSSIKTDDSVWYSEEADVRGRIWLGMTEKEVYDVLNKYGITIVKTTNIYECDEYGALCLPPEDYCKKYFATKGHQSFWFDEDDRLVEIRYFGQMHPSGTPVNEEFESQRGVKRADDYEDMIRAYGEPDKVISAGSNQSDNHSYVYYLENGDYLHFVYQGAVTPIQSIHYCKFPHVFSYD